MSKIDLTPRLRLAADYLETYGWVKGILGSPGQSACLTGAIRFCAPAAGDEHLIRQVLSRRGRAESWNDSMGVEGADVIDYLRTAEITDADLEQTFGPQWREIVALVRATAGLTRDQIVAFRRPAYDYAYAYAYAAAAGAAYDYAAAEAAAYAVYAAAADAYAEYGGVVTAAAYAARGLAVRHLISKYGFTQKHYDTLTGLWAKVMGPAHPGDVIT